LLRANEYLPTSCTLVFISQATARLPKLEKYQAETGFWLALIGWLSLVGSH
jgi:hypothetical protein